MCEPQEQSGDFRVPLNNAGNDERYKAVDVAVAYRGRRTLSNQGPKASIAAWQLKHELKGRRFDHRFRTSRPRVATRGYPVYTTAIIAVRGRTGPPRDLGLRWIRVNAITAIGDDGAPYEYLAGRSGRKADGRG
jgi:hypothetical protein